MPNGSQRAPVSGKIGMCSPYTRSPLPAAVASSQRPVTRPPSVGSCMPVTCPASVAVSAASTTLSPGSNRKRSGPLDQFVRHATAELAAFLARQESGALDSDALRQENPIAHLKVRLADQPRPGDLTEHLADEEWATEAGGHLGVATADRHAQGLAGRTHVGHDRIHQACRRAALRQEQYHEKPARSRTHDGDVVGVDMNRVRSDAVGGKGDRVGGDHEAAVRRRRSRRHPHPPAGQ